MLKATSARNRTEAAALAAILLAAAPGPAAGNIPWPDLGDAERAVTVRTGQVVHPHFGGVGYHVFDHAFPIAQDHLEQVVAKRWREVNPSFVRMNHEWNWDASTMDRMVAFMRRFQRETGTEIYLTTWNPKDVPAGAERAAYARLIVDQLERFVRKEGIANLKWYCMTNELSLSGWGKMVQDLPKFRDYHQELDRELRSRKLDVRLLATDASPISYWHTIEWAARNMDDITGIYGGHHYINDFALEDERFYPWFLARVEWGVGIGRGCKKDFILGEFGPKQDGRTINGIRMDQCVYWGTPKEPLVPIQVCEAAIAAINGGVYALGYWTFMDFPDRPQTGYANKWGLFKWSGTDCSTRPIYYAYGLLSKFFRGPATTYKVECADPRLRIAGVEHHGAKTWSIAVVSRNKAATRLTLTLDGRAIDGSLRKYVYDPANVPTHPFGDLQPPAGKVELRAGRLTDVLAPGTLTVYTTAYDDQPPAAVRGLKLEAADGGKVHLSWQPSPDPDLCYYRIYRSAAGGPSTDVKDHIASTIATRYVDAAPPAGGDCWYKVVAVDQSGNAGPAASVAHSAAAGPPRAASGPAGPKAQVGKTTMPTPVTATASAPRIIRFAENPIITPAMLGAAGHANINGPSLIRVPAWVEKPLGRYYLYFADHQGKKIKLAYADALKGPWKLHPPGTLSLEQAKGARGHIASPDVIADDERREIRMYLHGGATGGQKTFVATSKDGLEFAAGAEPLAPFYLRVWRWQGRWYGMSKGGLLWRSKDGLTPFEKGPNPLPGGDRRGGAFNDPGPRHVAVDPRGSMLWVYYSSIGDAPEHIQRCRIELSGDWTTWRAADVQSILKPEMEYEGARLPLHPSKAGAAAGPENALRDPAIFVEAGWTYLLYSVAGESGIAVAEVPQP